MKLFILSDELAGNGPVWMNIFWPHYTAYADSVPTVLMSTPYRAPGAGRVGSHWLDWQETRAHGERLCDMVRAERDPAGPNILVVWAINHRDIMRARLLAPVWDLFDVTVLWILDTIHPAHTKLDFIKRFDTIASICGDIGKDFETATGLPVIYMPPHTDVLRHAATGDYRPLDLLVIGRRYTALYKPIHFHFNTPEQKRFSLDMVTRTRNFAGSAEDECQLLMGAYARTKISFCFEPSNAHPRFKGYSPMTERWPHSWASGCTVVGKQPTGRGAADQMDWPEATIELPEAPEDAIEMVEALLNDTDGLHKRRLRNVAEAARRHDTRRRFNTLLQELDLPIPERLTDGLQRLDRMSQDLFEEAA